MSLYSGANICKCSRIESVVLVEKKKKKKGSKMTLLGIFA